FCIGFASRNTPSRAWARQIGAAAELLSAARYAVGSMRRISASIHCSTGVSPVVSIGLPIDTVTIPAYLRNELRGHTRPALCAIGTTGAPVAIAKRAPPVLYLPCLPVGVRVPSGNMMT